jgi:hypothetical protein
MKFGTASPANSSGVGGLGAVTVTSDNGGEELVCAKAAETLTSEMTIPAKRRRVAVRQSSAAPVLVIWANLQVRNQGSCPC